MLSPVSDEAPPPLLPSSSPIDAIRAAERTAWRSIAVSWGSRVPSSASRQQAPAPLPLPRSRTYDSGGRTPDARNNGYPDGSILNPEDKIIQAAEICRTISSAMLLSTKFLSSTDRTKEDEDWGAAAGISPALPPLSSMVPSEPSPSASVRPGPATAAIP